MYCQNERGNERNELSKRLLLSFFFEDRPKTITETYRVLFSGMLSVKGSLAYSQMKSEK